MGDIPAGAHPLDVSPKSNWVEKAGGLPRYIEEVATDLHQERGYPISQAIQIAIGVIKRWASGRGKVSPETKAKAAAALAEWERLKAKSHVQASNRIDQLDRIAAFARVETETGARGSILACSESWRGEARKPKKSKGGGEWTKGGYAAVKAAEDAAKGAGKAAGSASKSTPPAAKATTPSVKKTTPDKPKAEPTHVAVEHASKSVIDRGDHPDHPMAKGAFPAGDPRNDPKYARYYDQRTRLSNEYTKKVGDTKSRNSSGGAYSPDRQAEHDRIIRDVLNANSHIPDAKQLIVMGGLPGAGKSTFIRDPKFQKAMGVEVDDQGRPSNFMVVNPDDLKEILLNRVDSSGKPLVDLAKDYPGLLPNEAASLVHEESSDLAQAIANRAIAVGKNVIFDITLNSDEKARRKFIDPAKAKGYSVRAAFVDAPIEVALHRAGLRHKRINTTGIRTYSGRMVPLELISNSKRGDSTVNRVAYDNLVRSGVLDSAVRYTDGKVTVDQKPKTVEVGKPKAA